MPAGIQSLASSGNPGPSLAEFEAHAFDVESFDHEAHLYVAWLYLQQYDLLESLDRFRSTLIRLTRKLGIPGKYHETITWFYMIAVAEGAIGPARDNWELFKGRNPAIFRRSPGLIRDYYSEGRLMSDEARTTFLLPDQTAVG
ncbi:MAG: hypothetical protein OEM63_08800 [Gammaproteobacteria bacterium]|nr:hypothetical protein [Gammaproteobacteria bacterium]